jgi:hypothetical protein
MMFVYGQDIPLDYAPVLDANLNLAEDEREAIPHMFKYGVEVPLEIGTEKGME